MTRIICFDTETTGFDYANGDKIIEIGAIEVMDGKITGRTFHEYINPERQISADAYNVHKISNAFLADKPLFPEVAKRFLDFAGDGLIVAHNGKGFDFPFINFQLEQCGMPKIPQERQEDTMLMAQRKIAELNSYSLDSIAKYFNISLETREDAHGALIDTEILAKVYLELAQSADKKTVAEIAAEQHRDFLAATKFGGNFPHRAFAPSAEELAIHEEWNKQNNPKSLWNE
ncbi:MAG: ribonuclease H-like domain-containing protein [Rickettsiales bacterium]|jgi:DNA polymerase-3 subunit epsilon|nr:ribonuclease H-like domain-containing protein [Rickettsiales bacterium]